MQQERQALLGIHNNIRSENGLPALKEDGRLSIAAQKHAQWLALSTTISHAGPNGNNVGDRVTNEEYPWRSAGENIALGHKSVLEVMEGWVNSPGHYENILGDFQDVGIGMAKNRRGRRVWVVVFGRPKLSN